MPDLSAIDDLALDGLSKGLPADAGPLRLGDVGDQGWNVLAEDLPPGFLFDWSGEAENMRTADREATVFFLMALLIVYMVLAAQFESLIHPLTIIFTVPLAALIVSERPIPATPPSSGMIGAAPRKPVKSVAMFSPPWVWIKNVEWSM